MHRRQASVKRRQAAARRARSLGVFAIPLCSRKMQVGCSLVVGRRAGDCGLFLGQHREQRKRRVLRCCSRSQALEDYLCVASPAHCTAGCRRRPARPPWPSGAGHAPSRWLRSTDHGEGGPPTRTLDSNRSPQHPLFTRGRPAARCGCAAAERDMLEDFRYAQGSRTRTPCLSAFLPASLQGVTEEGRRRRRSLRTIETQGDGDLVFSTMRRRAPPSVPHCKHSLTCFAPSSRFFASGTKTFCR